MPSATATGVCTARYRIAGEIFACSLREHQQHTSLAGQVMTTHLAYLPGGLLLWQTG